MLRGLPRHPHTIGGHSHPLCVYPGELLLQLGWGQQSHLSPFLPGGHSTQRGGQVETPPQETHTEWGVLCPPPLELDDSLQPGSSFCGGEEEVPRGLELDVDGGLVGHPQVLLRGEGALW